MFYLIYDMIVKSRLLKREYQCLGVLFPSCHLPEKISQKIHLITTYIDVLYEREGDGHLKIYFFLLCFSWKLGKYYQQKDDLFFHHLRIILSVTNTAGQMSKFSKATFLSSIRQPYCFTNFSLTSK